MTFKGANGVSKIFLFYCRKIGEHPAKIRLINALHRLFKNEIKVKGVNNTVLNLVPKDFISGQIIFEKTYEPASLEMAMAVLKNTTGSFIDVGANIGLYSAAISKSFPGRTIVSIEPESGNYFMLNKNIALNNVSVDKIYTLNIAVGPTSGLVQLERPINDNNGTFRVVVGEHNAGSTNRYCPLLTLDTVFKSLNINHISLMKIDVEGFEMEVFKGMTWEEAYKPENIIMEYSDYVSRTGTSANEIMDYLTERGYKPFTVDKKSYSNGDPLPEDNLLFTLSKLPPVTS